VIAWTYDPLIRRNAYFNLVKLGARPVEYLRNFYGVNHTTSKSHLLRKLLEQLQNKHA